MKDDGQMLELLGVKSESSEVYVALLDVPAQTLETIMMRTGMEEGRVTSSLDDLVKRGIAVREADTFYALPLARAVDMLILRQEHELAAHQIRLSEYRAQAENLKSRFLPNEMLEAEVVIGNNSVWERLRDLAGEAQFQVDTFSPGGALSVEAISESEELDGELRARGVNARSVYLTSAKKDSRTFNHLVQLAENGEEVRMVSKLPVRMILFDKNVVALPISILNGMYGIAVYRNPVIVKALQELFELTWITAQPLGFKPAEVKKGLSEPEKIILEMIGQGKNDAEIGKKLGVVDRTVRRRITAVMDRLGVASREEAIYQAAKNGWI
jgi:DNA-binding NarL/FixJ family response regulator